MSSSAEASGAGGIGSKRQVLVKLVKEKGKKRRLYLQEGSATRSGESWTVRLKKCDKQQPCSGCDECEYEIDEESWFSFHANDMSSQ